MADITFKTNHQRRTVVRWWELTCKERAEFDYIDTQARQDEATFVRYCGTVYDLNDMEKGCGGQEMPTMLKGWDDYLSDNHFSGIVIQYRDRAETVICGRWFC